MNAKRKIQFLKQPRCHSRAGGNDTVYVLRIVFLFIQTQPSCHRTSGKLLSTISISRKVIIMTKEKKDPSFIYHSPELDGGPSVFLFGEVKNGGTTLEIADFAFPEQPSIIPNLPKTPCYGDVSIDPTPKRTVRAMLMNGATKINVIR
jgi:hypothetical protein